MRAYKTKMEWMNGLEINSYEKNEGLGHEVYCRMKFGKLENTKTPQKSLLCSRTRVFSHSNTLFNRTDLW